MQESLIGKSFYDLTVIEEAGTTRYGKLWRCMCRCGESTIVVTTKLKSGKNKSCGCRKIGKQHHMYSGFEGIPGCFWARVKSHAKSRGLVLEVSIEEAWNKFLEQKKKCALTGIDITLPANTKEYISAQCTASLDRINSEFGYTLDNTQWVHKDINLMKLDMNNNNFIYWCHKVSAHTIDTDTLLQTNRKRWSSRKKK